MRHRLHTFFRGIFMKVKGWIIPSLFFFELIIFVACIVRVVTWSPSSDTVIAFIPKTRSSPYWVRMEDAMKSVSLASLDLVTQLSSELGELTSKSSLLEKDSDEFLNVELSIQKLKVQLQEAKSKSFKLITQAAPTETDVMQQVQIMENMILKGVDLIILAPSGSRQLVTTVKEANRKGIPVVIIDSQLDEELVEKEGVELVCYVGSDNFEGGYLAGQYIGEKLTRGKVAVLEGIVGHESSDARISGFLSAIGEYPGLILASRQVGLMDRKKGFDVTQDILSRNGDIEALFAANDEMAMGAVEAVDMENKLNQIHVVGFDANSDAKKSVLEGRLSATVAQFPDKMGEIALEKGLSYLLQGELKVKKYGSPLKVLSSSNIENYLDQE